MGIREQSHAALQAELHGERAHTLGRIARGMEKSLAALRDFDAGVAVDPERSRADLLAEAAEWVWFYVVQRDVLGMHGHDDALRAYQVPDEVRFRMGPRRRRT